jgi:hypothetical protein
VREVLERIYSEVSGGADNVNANYLAILTDEEIILYIIARGKLGQSVSDSYSVWAETALRIMAGALRRDRDSKQVEL